MQNDGIDKLKPILGFILSGIALVSFFFTGPLSLLLGVMSTDSPNTPLWVAFVVITLVNSPGVVLMILATLCFFEVKFKIFWMIFLGYSAIVVVMFNI